MFTNNILWGLTFFSGEAPKENQQRCSRSNSEKRTQSVAEGGLKSIKDHFFNLGKALLVNIDRLSKKGFSLCGKYYTIWRGRSVEHIQSIEHKEEDKETRTHTGTQEFKKSSANDVAKKVMEVPSVEEISEDSSVELPLEGEESFISENHRLPEVSENTSSEGSQEKIAEEELSEIPDGQQTLHFSRKEIPVRSKLKSLRVLSEYGIKKEEYLAICDWYEKNKKRLESSGRSHHLSQAETGLPCTVIYINNGPHKGLHIRSKMTVGIGTYNKATRALHVETGKAKVIRAGGQDDVPEAELKCNNTLATIDPNRVYFATGSYVSHKGKMKNRGEMYDQLPEEFAFPADIRDYTKDVEKMENVDKLSLIMDEVPGGELADDLRMEMNERQKNSAEYMQILIHLTNGLILAHDNGIVDLDYKPENIFMDGSIPKMADFGMAHVSGNKEDRLMGSPGYLSPEVINATNASFTVQPGNQMWIHGCIMAEMFKGYDFCDWLDQDNMYNMLRVTDQSQLSVAIERFFPENKNEGSIDWCIAQCLQYKPESRISAKNLLPHLKKLSEKL